MNYISVFVGYLYHMCVFVLCRLVKLCQQCKVDNMKKPLSRCLKIERKNNVYNNNIFNVRRVVMVFYAKHDIVYQYIVYRVSVLAEYIQSCFHINEFWNFAYMAH